jgi:GAF domain-containing protein
MPDPTSEDIQKLIQTVRAVQSGEYHSETLADLAQRAGEIGQLARVFDHFMSEWVDRNRQMTLMRKVIPTGVALSAEKNFNRLLETVVVEAQSLTNADGGTLYLLTESQLEFVILRNTSLDICMGGTSGNPISFEPVALYNADDQPNYSNVASYAALKRQRVNLADAYEAEGFDFSGTRTFDARSGYRSKSFLTIPLEGTEKQVIGVLQLINAIDPHSGRVVPFASDEVLETLVLLASAALDGYIREEKLRQEIAKLRIEIDQSRRDCQVAEITDTEYFRSLQGKARQLRKNKK